MGMPLARRKTQHRIRKGAIGTSHRVVCHGGVDDRCEWNLPLGSGCVSRARRLLSTAESVPLSYACDASSHKLKHSELVWWTMAEREEPVPSIALPNAWLR